jgi:hypothetical protein
MPDRVDSRKRRRLVEMRHATHNLDDFMAQPEAGTGSTAGPSMNMAKQDTLSFLTAATMRRRRRHLGRRR